MLSKLTPRVYYAAKRHRFTIPYPVEIQYNVDAKEGIPAAIPHMPSETQSVITSLLQTLSYFANLEPQDLERVIQETRLLTYGAGELILQEDRPDEGFYILAKGQVRMYATNQQGKHQELGQLEPGDIFGETAFFPGELSMVTAIAKTDVEVAVIPDDVILDLIQTKPKFATAIVQFLESGKSRVRYAKGITGHSRGSAEANKTRNVLLNTY